MKSFLAMKSTNQAWDRALVTAGWRVRRPSDVRADFEVRKGSRTYLVQVERARESRQDLVRGRLADAVLQAQSYSQGDKRTRALAVVIAPHLSDRMRQQLRAYMDEVAPDMAYGLVDDRGHAEFHRVEKATIVALPKPSAPGQVSVGASSTLFSDLNQWLLKVLLGDRFPKDLLATPTGQPFRNATTLADAAKVSLPSTTRLINALENDGFLDRTSGYLRLIRVAELLERWAAESVRRPVEVRTRFAVPSSDLDRQLGMVTAASAAAPEARAALGLFSAASHFGARFVKGAPRHMYLRDVSAAMLEKFGLIGTTDNSLADVIVRKPTAPESVSRGFVQRAGTNVTDVLQTWLDLSSHPARGREQAEVLWRKHIAAAVEGS